MSQQIFYTSLQRETLTHWQTELSSAIEQALDHLGQISSGLQLKHLSNLAQHLSQHEQILSKVYAEVVSLEDAPRYVQLLSSLRLRVESGVTLMATEPHNTQFIEGLENLCWQTLAAGVLWLDSLEQAADSAPAGLSQVGQNWERVRSQSSGSSAALPAASQAYTPIEREITRDIEIDQILYCSLASQPLSPSQLEALEQVSQRLNRLDRISGMLLYGSGMFVQLLEGPREAVNALWARLLKDKRHFCIVQLYHRREVEERSCPNWKMQMVERKHLLSLIHEAKEEITPGRKSAWAPVLDRMDFLLTQTDWLDIQEKQSQQGAEI